MNNVLTTSIRIYPTPEQEQALKETTQAYTRACNHVSEWVRSNQTLKQRAVHDALYYEIRQTYGLGAQMSASVIRTVIAAYKTVHATQQRWTVTPVFKRHQYKAVYGRDYSFVNGQLSLNTLDGRIRLDYRENPALPLTEGKLGTATIRNKHGKWLMHIPIEFEVPKPQTPQNIVGVDRGIRHLAVTHDSDDKTRFYSGAEVKNKRAHYKQLRSELQAKQTRSARKRLKSIGDRENRWMSDVNHCVSKALVTTQDRPTLFVLEDLSGIQLASTKVRRKNRYLHVSWAYYQLGQFLKYKAERAGHTVIEVDPRYTSQTCPKCAHVSKNNRKQAQHLFACQNCGYTSNDDRVAAMNLSFKGKQYLTQSQLSTP